MVELTPEEKRKLKTRKCKLLNKVIELTNVEYEHKDIVCLELVEDLVKMIENYKKCFDSTFKEMAKELPMYEKSIISEFEIRYLRKVEEKNGKRI